ncbi:MAG: hypothetical protein V4717_07560 [Bacteroidota bacterium]
MNNLKRIDYYGQILLMAASLVLVIINRHLFLLMGYIAVGSWQFLSCLFHFIGRDNLLRQRSRHLFEFILVVLPVAALAFLLFPLLLNASLPALIWVSPVLAVWYCYITNIELNIWEARALIQLR